MANSKKRWKQLEKERKKMKAHNKAQKKKLEQQIRLIELNERMECTHMNRKGEAFIKPVGGENSKLFECKRCGMEFDMTVWNKGHIKNASRVLVGMAEQLRMLCDADDTKILKKLSEFQLNLEDISALYKAVVKKKAKEAESYRRPGKNKSKNRARRSSVGFGYGG